jgi:hypothetical protein
MKTKAKTEPDIRIEPVKGQRGEAAAHPFTFVAADAVAEHGGRRYRVIIYGAYNARGLIGPEHNGIAVLDEDAKDVVTDRICPETTGYFGPSKKQIDEWRRLVEADDEEFVQLVNASERLRHAI